MPKTHYNPRPERVSQKKILKNRLFFAMGFVLFLFFILIFRMSYLQWVNYDLYKSMAEGNRISTEVIPPTRGRIYDRNGILLAGNQPVFVLEFDKRRVKNIEQTQVDLAKLLPNLPLSTTERFFNQLKRYYNARPLTLPINLTEEQAAIFSVQSHQFPGVTLAANLKRIYPFKSNLAHALGYVGKINSQEMVTLDRDRYRGTKIIGRTGIERQYEDLLHGHPGFQEIETNVRGRIVRTLRTTPSTPGQNIRLTIDIHLQAYIESLLGDRKASVVVMKPQTGEVLALVSNPTFDLNSFIGGISQKELNKLLNHPYKPLINRATNGQYPPASTVKAFMSLASLENSVITEEETIFDPGYFMFKGHRFRNWNRAGHGIVNMKAAIAQSCDTYYYKLGLDMGINMIHDYLYPFGFGRITGIDLPTEKAGILPSREWKQEARGEAWLKGETIITAIGQGFFLATPIQLAKSVSILANRGKIIRPHLLKNKIIENQGHIPIKQHSHWENVIQAKVEAMHGRRGTGRNYTRDINFQIAGKTGTAQVFSLHGEEYDAESIKKALRNHSLFTGFTPVKNPEVAISIVIENADIKAAPVAVDILEFYLNKISHPSVTGENNAY